MPCRRHVSLLSPSQPPVLFLSNSQFDMAPKLGAMLKPRLVASQLLKKRVEDKRDKKNLLLNSADLQVVGSYSQGFRPSLLVNSEGNAYLFNCSEGTQRYCYTNKVKLSNLGHLFITNMSWNRVAGAFGLSLTIQDVGSPSFTLHATEGIKGFFESTKTFMSFNTGIKCSTQSHLDGEYKDSSIHVKPIALDEGVSVDKAEHHDLEEDHLSTLKKVKVHPKLIAYVCSLPDLPGALDPQKCRELNVPIGPLLGVLKSGCDVTLSDGTIVKSSDVCGPKSLGPRFIVVECPTTQDIDLIANNISLNEFKNLRQSRNESQINMVVHFSPEDVTSHPKYREWINGFPDECKHLLLINNKPKRANFIDSYRLQYLLRKLDDVIFPPLYLPDNLSQDIDAELADTPQTSLEYGLADADETEIRTFVKVNMNDLDKIINVSALDRFIIRPNKIIESVEPRMSIDALYRAAKVDPQFEKYLEEYKEKQEELLPPRQYEPEVVFLGTGSALPSKLRNTSGILINMTVPQTVSVILDCGEDTYGQLIRFYGPEKAKNVLKQLKMIYVSHHHADHHIGLIQILRHRKNVTDEPIILLLPPGVELLLDYHNENFEDLSKTYTIFNTKSFKTKFKNQTNNEVSSIKSDLCNLLNGLLKDITIVGVEHCANSCAIVLNFKIGQQSMDSFTLAYSGDARPSEDFILAGKDCDLLIHEATFDHRSQEDALLKKHSTSSEAIQVARKMQAKFTILTHFSQRLPKIPYFTKEFDDKIGFAFDNMAVRCPSHFGRIPIMKKILGLIFSKSINEIDMKYLKQEAKQNLLKSQSIRE